MVYRVISGLPAALWAIMAGAERTISKRACRPGDPHFLRIFFEPVPAGSDDTDTGSRVPAGCRPPVPGQLPRWSPPDPPGSGQRRSVVRQFIARPRALLRNRAPSNCRRAVLAARLKSGIKAAASSPSRGGEPFAQRLIEGAGAGRHLAPFRRPCLVVSSI